MSEPLTRDNLIADLRRIGRERGLDRPALGALMGRTGNAVPAVGNNRGASFDALIQWMDKLGLQVRYEIVAKTASANTFGSGPHLNPGWAALGFGQEKK